MLEKEMSVDCIWCRPHNSWPDGFSKGFP